MAVVVGRVYVWPIEPHCLRDLSNVCHQPLWWWYRWWIHLFIPLWMWYLLLRGLPLQDVLLPNVSPNVGVRIGVESLGHLCPKINPGVDRCLGIFPLHWKSYILLVRVWRQRITSGRKRLARLLFQCDRVQDSHEEQKFWMTRLDLVGIRLNQFEMFEEHENCISRWKQCCSRWKQCWMKTMYK